MKKIACWMLGYPERVRSIEVDDDRADMAADVYVNQYVSRPQSGPVGITFVETDLGEIWRVEENVLLGLEMRLFQTSRVSREEALAELEEP